MILLDTAYLVALVRKNDANHERADELAKGFEEKTIISGWVFSETANYLIRKDGSTKVLPVLRHIRASDAIFVAPSDEDIKPALDLIEKYDHLSFTDASNVIVMQRLNIKKIASFDSDFDRVIGVQRIF